MLNFTHMLVGAAIASKVSPVIGLPLAFASHFALDAIPHYDGLYPNRPFQVLPLVQIILDFTLGIILLSKLTVDNPQQYYMVIAALVAISPDVIQGLYQNFASGPIHKFLTPFSEFHNSIQEYKPPVWVGLLTTVITSLIAIWAILS